MLFFEVIRKAGVIEQKRQNRKKKKKKKKRAMKDHKNDLLTDATRLKLVMKNVTNELDHRFVQTDTAN